jgi:multicomponent K+:H+ antiporter subunit A
MANLLLLLLVSPFAGAMLLAALAARPRPVELTQAIAAEKAQLHRAAWIAAAAAGLSALALLALAPDVMSGTPARARWSWLPALGIGFGLRLDGLALLFCGLIVGIGLLVVLYARYYLSADDRTARFYALLMAFMGAMLGIALADNLIVLAMAWELTSLISFLLIGFWQHRSDARRGARMALTVTGAGGLALLAGLLMLGSIAGSFELDTVLGAGDTVRAHPMYPVCLGLILLGAFTKSAQFPFHFWLPQAMAAPTPASAYLHSATMVKAGIFLLARLYPVLSGTELWFFSVTIAGGITLMIGAWNAIFKHDLKGLLAYSTISQLGLITMLLGLNSPLAAVAALFHLLNHATFKASLFMAAGIIDHETGTRDMRRINGLWRTMPVTAALAIVAAAAMAGVPLLNGFLSKEMFFEEALAVEGSRAVRFLVPAVAALAAALSVAYSARFIHDVFFNGEPVNLPRTPHEPPRFMRVPVEMLVVLCLVVGLAPQLTIGPLLTMGARDMLGGTVPEFSLAIWHGFNEPLLMSLAALIGGGLLYGWLQRQYSLHTNDDDEGAGKRLFDQTMAALVASARRINASIERIGMRTNLFLTVCVAIAAGALPWLIGPSPLDGITTHPFEGIAPVPLALWGIAVAATVASVILARERLPALVTVGALGLVVSLTFVWFSAPDLALTQLLVEVATMLVMMLSLRYLPSRSPRELDDRRKLRDGVIAATAGIGIGVLAWATMLRPASSLSDFFLTRALSEGGGTNATNVIIVDFRGFDTFGESFVMAAAGLVIHDLIARLSLAPVTGPARTGRLAAFEQRYPLMLATTARMLLPFALMVSVYFFLRGHNLPGGGFIAGLITAIVLMLQTVSNGEQALAPGRGSSGSSGSGLARKLSWLHTAIGLGLLIACLTGLGSWLLGYPFLTSSFIHPHLPVVGELPLASAAAFDLGVYLSVVGATVLALAGIGRLARGT